MHSTVQGVQHRSDRKTIQGSTVDKKGGEGLRILLIDDSPDDRTLIARELCRHFPKCAISEISGQTELNAALSKRAADLVITDYELYWSDGLRVIQRIKENWPDVPVLMFTGSGNEEVAVAAMKAGVEDYILKMPKNYSRLTSAVEIALEMHRHRCGRERAEERYKELFDTVPVGLFRCTPKGKILDANPAFAAMAGLSDKDDVLCRNFSELHPKSSDFDAWRDQLERDGAVAFVESRFKGRAQGEIRWIQIHAKALRDPETGQIYYEGSVEDITDRKIAEVEREKLITNLREALGKVTTLTGLLPICASCKKIRDEAGAWNVLESYIENHSQAQFTHSFCPDCAHRLYPEVFLDRPEF
jgi:PAS domain S-box-containing protein